MIHVFLYCIDFFIKCFFFYSCFEYAFHSDVDDEIQTLFLLLDEEQKVFITNIYLVFFPLLLNMFRSQGPFTP